VAIALAALVIAIVALVNANTANDNANKANNSLVNYTALPTGTVKFVSPAVTSNFSTIYEIPIPTTNWKFDGVTMGVLGNVAVPIPPGGIVGSVTNLSFITYATINSGTEIPIGASEEIANPIVTPVGYNVNISGVIGKVNTGDTVVLYVKAAATGGTVTVGAPPENSAAIVYGPVNV
jgi:hypothetical protein